MRTQTYESKKFLLISILAFLLFGWGIGLLIQGSRELILKNQLSSASPCPPSLPASDCLLTKPATILGYDTSYTRGYASKEVTLTYPADSSEQVKQITVDVEGGSAYSGLQNGEEAKLTFLHGHLLSIEVKEGTIKPTWQPGRYLVHFLVGVGFLLMGLFLGRRLLMLLFGKKKISPSSTLNQLEAEREREYSLPASLRYQAFLSHVKREGMMFSSKPMFTENGEEVFALWSDPDSVLDCCEGVQDIIPLSTQSMSEKLHGEDKAVDEIPTISLWDALKHESRDYSLVIYPTPSSPGKRVSEEELRRDLEG